MALVDEPEQVRITEVPGAEATTYEVRVASGDLGKVIGKDGRIASALRVIAKSVAMKYRQKIFLEIIAEDATAAGAWAEEGVPT